jgi:flagellar basal-body rod modification protein FlgD
MSVTPTNGVGSTSTKAAASPSDPMLDKDAFLKLLTAQLKYQDPMNPTDSSTFTTQMNQLSQTEQMTNVASDQRKLVAAADKSAAVALLGRTVHYLAKDGSTVTGTVSDIDVSSDSPTLTVAGVSGIDPASLLVVQ